MIYLSTFLYYTLFASVILFYGLGINQTVELSLFKTKSINYLIKVFITILLSILISWLITQFILVKLKIVEIFPVVCFLIYICISTFLEALVRITSNKSATEFLFSYLIIIISVFESNNILYTLVIGGSCMMALVCIMPFTFSFRSRLQKENISNEKFFVRFLLFISVIIVLISVLDIMWMNPGVIK